jgi:hypothetical protein
VPSSSRIASLKNDYRDMAMMIFGKAPSFDKILATLTQLESEVNRLGRPATRTARS